MKGLRLRQGWVGPVRALAAGVLLFGAGLIAGAFIAHAQPPDFDSSRPLVPGVWCPGGDQDLGNVWQTDALEIPFRLANDSKEETFHISALHGGCACTTVTPQELTLEPGQTASVKAVVDLEGGLAPESLPKEFSETVLGTVRGRWGDELALQMNARLFVQSSYRVSPPVGDFGRVIRGEEPQVITQVECLSPQAPRRLDVVSAPDWVQTTVEGAPGKPREFRIAAGVRPDAPYGSLEGRVRFRAELPTGPFATRSVALRALVVDDLSAMPSPVIFGTVAPGEERTVMLTLRSARGQAFGVEGLGEVRPPLRLQQVRVESPSATIYALSLKAAAEGEFDERVTFHIRTAAGRLYSLEVPVWAYVTAAAGR
jgi:hypothetical protein